MVGIKAEPERLEGALETALIKGGVLGSAPLARARRVAGESGEPLDIVLTRLGLVSEGDMVAALAGHLGLAAASREDYPAEPVLEGRLSPRFLKEFRVVPLRESEDAVVLAMADPLDSYAISAVELATGKRVEVRVAAAADIEAALAAPRGKAADGLDGLTGAGIADEGAAEEDIARLKDLASEAPVIKLVDSIIARAVEIGASDIHFEPFDAEFKLRYRIDGVLREMEPPPLRLRAAITSRIKLTARLNIAESRVPQDGRIRLAVRGKEIDFRVSTVPTMYGESVVLRILDRSAVALDFTALGFSDALLAEFLKLIDRPTGMLLVTGPTGSGKTTTLYSALKRLNTGDRKILTVEDPPEYQLEGINQVPVRPQVGLTFANALRSLLRQDPDVIMIGEIRDLETAEIAVQAALTGHKVLSTLHTNDAASTVTRLLEMGVADYLLTSTLDGVAAQRLVRTLCPDCREPVAAPPELVEELGLERLADGRPVTLYHGRGCQRCAGTGYRGRTSIVEMVSMTEPLRRAVMQRAGAGEIQRAAVQSGMVTMYEAGLRKALAGVTTLEEVLRVTREV